MSGFDVLRNLRTALPSGEPEKTVVVSKKKIVSKIEEDRATTDWLESFGATGVINKNGIRKFVSHSNQPKQENQPARATGEQRTMTTALVKKPIIKTVADDDELLRLMNE
ncbi:MAG: hypothetical protein WCP79_05865 [Bacillota bacterium]